MNRNSKTYQPQIEEIGTRAEAEQQRLREANERLEAEMSDRRRAEQAIDGREERLKTPKVRPGRSKQKTDGLGGKSGGTAEV